MLPIIGKKTKEDKMLRYQQEMRKKLSDWEIENECFISPRMVSTPNSTSYQAILDFHQLSNDELCDYKIKINEHESIKNSEKDLKTD